MRFFTKVIAGVFVAIVSNATWGEVYKHIDKSGRVQYSDQPFRYKQETMAKENRARRLIPGWKRDKHKFVYGIWELNGVSTYHGGALDSTRDVWTFDKDGALSKKLKHANRVSFHFEYHDNLLEIRGKDSRQTYNILELNNKKMVLNLQGTNHYLHFSRKLKSTAAEKADYYQRDQVAKIVSMIACGEIRQGELDGAELDAQLKNIFIRTGIIKFDDEQFVRSVKFYRKDDIFHEVYEPKIAKNVEQCRKS